MKRIVILIVLVTIAGVAGVVVRSSKCSVGELRGLVSHNNAVMCAKRYGRVTNSHRAQESS